MNYSVTWTPDAEEGLAAVWVASADQAAVTAATHLLDTELKRRPLELGESRGSSVVRVAHRQPLGIEFEVIEDDKKVRVLRVWAVSSR